MIIDAVQKGITEALYAEFGEKYEIHTEASMQDMEEPAFFVRCATPSLPKRLGSRRNAELLFVVQYFPESEEPARAINDAYERLCGCLELIEVDDKTVRGTVECRDITDDVLTITAEYALFLSSQRSEDQMDGYEMKGVITDGSNS